MRITVWTPWGRGELKPKCIFIGETDILPRKGEYITARQGFACETVKSVSIDLVKKEVEISIEHADERNEYGPCLYSNSGEQS